MNSRFIEFVALNTHLKTVEVLPDLKLYADLSIVGVEAIDFFENFFTTFKIQNIEEFNINLYIEGGPDFAPQPLKWIKNIVIKDRRKFLNPDVTLGHLNEVVERGEWF